MNDINEIGDICNRLVDFGLKNGADQAEIFAINEKTLSVQQNGESMAVNSNVTAGLGIRMAIGKRWGFTSSSSLDIKNAESEVKEAIKIAKIRDEDDNFFGFPPPKLFSSEYKFTSTKLKNLAIEEIISSLKDARIKGLAVNPNLVSVQGAFSIKDGQKVIVNSSDLYIAFEKTSFSAGFSAVGTYGDHRFSENSFTGGTQYNNNLDDLAIDAANRTAEMFGATVSVPEGNMSLLMEPTAAAIFLIAVTRLIFKGDLAVSHRSIFQSKDLNTEIASPEFTFIDDGTLQGGIKAAPCDDEGSPSKTTRLIEKGILKTFLYDYSTAVKAGVDSTGNAVRGIGHGARSYTALPTIGSRDRLVSPGHKSQDEIIEEIDHGILIGYPAGIFLSNPMTTDFTIFPTRVLEIKNGEIINPVLGTSIAGNGIKWLKKIISVGNDTTLMESVISPSILFSNVDVTSTQKTKESFMPKRMEAMIGK